MWRRDINYIYTYNIIIYIYICVIFVVSCINKQDSSCLLPTIYLKRSWHSKFHRTRVMTLLNTVDGTKSRKKTVEVGNLSHYLYTRSFDILGGDHTGFLNHLILVDTKHKLELGNVLCALFLRFNRLTRCLLFNRGMKSYPIMWELFQKPWYIRIPLTTRTVHGK